VQLASLQLERLGLQLQPGIGAQGVLGAAATVAAIKQLQLHDCELLDDGADEVVAAALSQLPAGLEHLSISNLKNGGVPVDFPAGVLHQMQDLTYLELGCSGVAGPDEASPALQPLQALTRLVDLRFCWLDEVVTCSMLSGMQHLTRLELLSNLELEPGVLAGITQLQHLYLNGCRLCHGRSGLLGGAVDAMAAQLLSSLQPMQQLTHLLFLIFFLFLSSLRGVEKSTPPASYALGMA
jgi:hypothetical protein